MGAITQEYRASSDLTVTNLHSLASSASYIAGWESPLIDNTSNKDFDIEVTCKFTMASANNQAGEIRAYVVPMLDDSNWPAPFDGTESTESITDTEERDSMAFFARSVAVDTSTGALISMCFSIRAACGFMPAKCVIFITGNGTTTTTAQFAASGNQVTIKGLSYSVA